MVTQALAVHVLGSYLRKLGEFFISVPQDNPGMLLQRTSFQQDGATAQLVCSMNRTCPEWGIGETVHLIYADADKSLAWPGRKQTTVTEDFEFHISY